MIVCAAEWCDRPRYSSNGLCPMHYARWKRHGDAGVRMYLRGAPVRERFMSHVVVQSNDCWQWVAHSQRGYGMFKWDGHVYRAHQAAYMLWVGEIPPGLELDHLCCNKGCVNPQHLEPVTHRENMNRRRVVNQWDLRPRPTHCKRGHPFSEANTRTKPNGARECKTCDRLRKRGLLR